MKKEAHVTTAIQGRRTWRGRIMREARHRRGACPERTVLLPAFFCMRQENFGTNRLPRRSFCAAARTRRRTPPHACAG